LYWRQAPRYCCQELCPNDAINLRRPLLARM